MAYIVKRKNREGKFYVYLIESFREKDKVKKRTLKSYGSLEELERNEPGAYERLRKQAQEGVLTEDLKSKFNVSYDLNHPLYDSDLDYGWKILEDIFLMLEIPQALSAVFSNSEKRKQYQRVLELLVYQRIINPGSKLHMSRSQRKLFGDWRLTNNGIYRSLEPISRAKEAITLRAHNQITKQLGRTGLLVFYDVTNYYFDIDFNDKDIVDKETGEMHLGLRKCGPCKAKSGKPIVQMGLFMDTKGIPISYTLFRGNQTDPVTYLPAIEQVKKQFGLERIIVVADKAMNSKKNISETHKQKDGWLFSQKHRGKRGAPKDIQEYILDPYGWIYNESITFASKSTIRTRNLSEKGETIQEKVLVTWSEKYAIREKIRREGALDYAKKLTDAELFRQTSKKGGKKYLELSYQDPETKEIKPFSPLIQLDKEQIAFDEQFDGINVLVTSELDMSDEEMIEHYRELSKIEDCFRISKTDFESKPVFVRLEDHIEAHFLTCFLALVMIRILQNKSQWQLSPGRIKNALESAKTHELSTGYYRVQGNEDFKFLLNELNINWEKGIVKYEQLKKFAKGWCTTKKTD